MFLVLTLLATLLAWLPYNLEGRVGRWEKQSIIAGSYFCFNLLAAATPWFLLISGIVDIINLAGSFINMSFALLAIKVNKPDEGSMILDWGRPTNIFRGPTIYFIVPIRQRPQLESIKKVDFDIETSVPFPKVGNVKIKGSFPFVLDGGREAQNVLYHDEDGTERYFRVPQQPSRVQQYILAGRVEGVKALYQGRIQQMMQQYFQALSDELKEKVSWQELRKRIYADKEINGLIEFFLFGASIPNEVLNKINGWPDTAALNLGIAFLPIMIDIEVPAEITQAETQIGLEIAQKDIERINAEAAAQAATIYLKSLGFSEEKIDQIESEERIKLGRALKQLRLAEEGKPGVKVETKDFNFDVSSSLREILPSVAEIVKNIAPIISKIEKGGKE